MGFKLLYWVVEYTSILLNNSGSPVFNHRKKKYEKGFYIFVQNYSVQYANFKFVVLVYFSLVLVKFGFNLLFRRELPWEILKCGEDNFMLLPWLHMKITEHITYHIKYSSGIGNFWENSALAVRNIPKKNFNWFLL